MGRRREGLEYKLNAAKLTWNRCYKDNEEGEEKRRGRVGIMEEMRGRKEE